MKRCVVTGASGLIGSHLLPRLAGKWEVHAVSRRAQAGSPGVTWHRADIAADPDRASLPEKVDAVIYLAQSEHFRDFPERAADILKVNTLGLLQYLEYARRGGASNFVYASSGGVYGAGDHSLNEDLPVLAAGDLGFYLSSKLCSEIVALNYARLLNLSILRFFFVYGPGQRKTMLIPRLIDSVRNGAPVTLQGEEGIRINPTYVEDAADSVVRALGLRASHTINVAGPEVLSLRALCDSIGRALGRTPRYKTEPGEARHLIGDATRMRELLGAPRVNFEEGLRRLLAAESGSAR